MKDSIKVYSKQKSLIKKGLKLSGFEDIKVSNGFYYFCGFAEKNGQTIYFSISDVRYSNDNKILLRTAKDRKDYIGGSNSYANLNDLEDITKMSNRLVKD